MSQMTKRADIPLMKPVNFFTPLDDPRARDKRASNTALIYGRRDTR